MELNSVDGNETTIWLIRIMSNLSIILLFFLCIWMYLQRISIIIHYSHLKEFLYSCCAGSLVPVSIPKKKRSNANLCIQSHVHVFGGIYAKHFMRSQIILFPLAHSTFMCALLPRIKCLKSHLPNIYLLIDLFRTEHSRYDHFHAISLGYIFFLFAYFACVPSKWG